MKVTTFYNQVLDQLNTALPSFIGPAHDLPTRDGSVDQCAVLWPTPGSPATRADAHGPHQRTETFTVLCIGATALDSLAAADKARTALTGWVPAPGSRPTAETGVPVAPATEPGTDPIRITTTLQFTTITKERPNGRN